MGVKFLPIKALAKLSDGCWQIEAERFRDAAVFGAVAGDFRRAEIALTVNFRYLSV